MTVPKKGRLLERLAKTAPGIERAIRDVNGKSANEMVSLAQSFVAVDSGDLKDSIRALAPGQHRITYSQGMRGGNPATSWRVTVGSSSVRYAHLVEFGTANGAPAQPYFFPSYRIVARKHKGRVTRAIRKATKAAAR